MAESLIHEFIITQPIIEVHETWVPTVSKLIIIDCSSDNLIFFVGGLKLKFIVEFQNHSNNSL